MSYKFIINSRVDGLDIKWINPSLNSTRRFLYLFQNAYHAAEKKQSSDEKKGMVPSLAITDNSS